MVNQETMKRAGKLVSLKMFTNGYNGVIDNIIFSCTNIEQKLWVGWSSQIVAAPYEY